MANGYSQSPKLHKGALIQFSAPLLIPVPNIIIFQYNPETMTRMITPWKQSENAGGAECSKDTVTAVNPLAQPIDPEETFNLTLELDAADALEDPDNNRVAVIAGVADRLAALEMLLYPPGDSGIGNLVSGIRSALGGKAADVVQRKTVQVVLFYWGLGRILPVRIESFSVEEQAYSPTLFPIRATVTLGLKILDAASFGDETSATVKLAKACYLYTRAQKETLALARIANESLLGKILPL
ncbi:MAG: hypothetical protein H0U18_17320 [Pyrinomonadaceae bacterium]|nr:hypothetical protein [Pyrinomonadaceae bacterium]